MSDPPSPSFTFLSKCFSPIAGGGGGLLPEFELVNNDLIGLEPLTDFSSLGGKSSNKPESGSPEGEESTFDSTL